MGVENDRHAGTMGWVDEPWYSSVSRFMEQQHAPADAKATFRFMRAIASYDWKHAVAEIDQVIKGRGEGIVWINEDLLRDGANLVRQRGRQSSFQLTGLLQT